MSKVRESIDDKICKQVKEVFPDPLDTSRLDFYDGAFWALDSGLWKELPNMKKVIAALEELAKPPYKDSDLQSLYEWMNGRAASALRELEIED